MKAFTLYRVWANDAVNTIYDDNQCAVTPKFVMAMSMGDTGGGTGGRQNYRKTIGFATGPSSRWSVAMQSVDAAGTSSCDKAQRTDSILCKISTAGAIDARLDINSFIGSGLQWIVDDVLPSANEYIAGIAFADTEITNVAIGVFDQATATGNNDITTVGFQPDLVILLSSFGIAPEPDIRAGASLGIGACDAALNQWAYGSRALDAVGTSDTGSYMRSGQIMAVPTSSAGIGTCLVRAELTSMLSNGFRLHYTETDSTVRRWGYLAVKGGHWRVGNLLTQTDVTTASTVSLGWMPSGGIFVSACRAESADDTPTADDNLSLGFWGNGTVSYTTTIGGSAMAARDVDAQGTTEVSVQLGYSNQVYVNSNPSSGFVDGSAYVSSRTPDGFSIKMDNADAAQCFVGYIVGGEPSTGVIGSGLLRENQ